jgi:teichuronic acid exporter
MSKGLSIILGILLARFIGPKDFGIFAIVLIINSIAKVFCNAGFGVALVQKVEIDDLYYTSVFWLNVLISVLLIALILISSPFISIFFNEPSLVKIINISSISILFEATSIIQYAKLTKSINFKKQTIIRIISNSIAGVFSVFLAFANYGIYALVWQLVISSFLNSVFLFYYEKWLPSFNFSMHRIKELFSFGMNMSLSAIFNVLIERIDSIITGKYFDFSVLGNLNRAQGINTLIVQLSSDSLNKVTFPTLVKMQNSTRKIAYFVYRSVHLVLFPTFLLMGFFFLFADEIIFILYGPKWPNVSHIFRVLSFTAFGYPLASIILNILTSTGNSKLFFQADVIKQISKVLLVVIFSMIFGFEGLLLSLALSIILGNLVNFYFCNLVIKGFFVKINKIVFLYFIPFILLVGILYSIQLIGFHSVFYRIILYLFYLATYFVLNLKGPQLLIKTIKSKLK